MKTFRYHLSNLDCANCAAKIENKLQNTDGFENVNLSFAKSSLRLDAEVSSDLTARVNSVISSVESDCAAIPIEDYEETRKELKSHGHNHSHEHGEHGESEKAVTVSLIAAGVMFVLAYVLKLVPAVPEWVQTALFLISVVFAGWKVFIEAIKSLRHISLDEHLLLMIAVVAACAIGEVPEAAAVTLFFGIGELLEDFAVGRSRRSINALSEIRPDTAHLVNDDGTSVQVAAKDVECGAVLRIHPFERVPLDCTVINGFSTVDTSALTGESVPQEVAPESNLLSGTVNGSGTLEVKVTNSYEKSAASRIIEMVESAAERKAPAERLITKFSRYYTPAVVVMAVLLAVIPPAFFGGEWTDWLHRSLVFLVASCPCAFVLSVPLGFFAGIGAASKQGVLVKGGTFVEKMNKVGAVVFDKTGTLTTDSFRVTKIHTVDNETEEHVASLAALAESRSSHPLARALTSYAGNLNEEDLTDYNEIPGRGVRAEIRGNEILCGAHRLMDENGLDCSAFPDCSVYVAKNGKVIGAIEMEGCLRDDAKQTVDELRALGVKRIVMLTGDHEQAAKRAAEECGITEYYAELLPEDKVEKVEEIKKTSGVTVFLGDGINDAPVLASADVGVAMGFGTDAAREAGDIVLTNDRPSKLPQSIRIFRSCMNVVTFNIVFALAVKAIVLILGAMNLAGMWAAVFADVGVTVIAVINSTRVLKSK